MRCPACDTADVGVIDSRPTTGNAIRRRRKCNACDHRFTTMERADEREAEEAWNRVHQAAEILLGRPVAKPGRRGEP